MDAGECLLNLVNTLDEEVYMTRPITKWISSGFTFTRFFSCTQTFSADFTQLCLSTPEIDDTAAFKATPHDSAMPHETLSSPTPTLLLREWVKATLARRSWRDTLVAAANVRISVYPDGSWA